MLVCDSIWSDTWFCSLEQRHKLLYLYLLCSCSKCGIFDLNMRKINFDLSNGEEDVKQYTKNEVMSFAGNRIMPVGDSRAIVVNYISINWMRGKPLNPDKNPLHRGLVQELARYGLTFSKLNEMAGENKLTWTGDDGECMEEARTIVNEVKRMNITERKKESATVDAWFDSFWQAYPSECPRKVDKKKCRDKFAIIIRDAKDKEATFNSIMSGINKWCMSDLWKSDGGKFIKAPLVWLNGSCWEDAPKSSCSDAPSHSDKLNSMADEMLKGLTHG